MNMTTTLRHKHLISIKRHPTLFIQSWRHYCNAAPQQKEHTIFHIAQYSYAISNLPRNRPILNAPKFIPLHLQILYQKDGTPTKRTLTHSYLFFSHCTFHKLRQFCRRFHVQIKMNWFLRLFEIYICTSYQKTYTAWFARDLQAFQSIKIHKNINIALNQNK